MAGDHPQALQAAPPCCPAPTPPPYGGSGPCGSEVSSVCAQGYAGVPLRARVDPLPLGGRSGVRARPWPPQTYRKWEQAPMHRFVNCRESSVFRRPGRGLGARGAFFKGIFGRALWARKIQNNPSPKLSPCAARVLGSTISWSHSIGGSLLVMGVNHQLPFPPNRIIPALTESAVRNGKKSTPGGFAVAAEKRPSEIS